MESGSGAITNVEHWSVSENTGAGVTRQLRPLVKRGVTASRAEKHS